MKTSPDGVQLIREFESFSPKAIRLPGEEYYTIGYGHYGPDVGPKQTMSKDEAEALLRMDLTQFEAYVNAYCSMYSNLKSPNQNQFDALVSFAYNCGPGNLRQLVSGRNAAEIAAHWMAYTGSASEAYRQGLTNRRRRELALFQSQPPAQEEEKELTREELMAVEGTGDHPSDWAKPATEWAKAEGIFAGDGNGNYGWQQPITREAIAQVLYQFAKRQK